MVDATEQAAGPGVGTPRDPAVTVPAFDLDAYLADLDPELLAEPEGRRVLCRTDPLLFALTYLPHHLASDETSGKISVSAFHLDLCESAQQWIRTDLGPAELREAWVAPRGAGKSTWVFLILPLWALAFGHRRFVAAFADSGPQAQQHLASLKRELDTNLLLRADFPDLCNPAKRQAGTSVSDNMSLYVARSGAAIMAKGIDASTLGAKVGNQRPDLLLFDDIEPDESNYSPYQKEKRQHTVVNAVFPMNLSAVVVIAGTVTMPGSIVHDVVRQVTRPGDAPAWPAEERIRARYYPPLLADDNGVERSLWPERWSTEFLQQIRHTRSYKLNFANDPVGGDGGYWTDADFIYGPVTAVTRWLISVDPAVTTKKTSDWTGIAIVGYSPSEGRCLVEHAEAVRVTGKALRAHLLKLLAAYPLVRAVLIEVNQGGETWADILHDMPVKVLTAHQTVKKEVRAANVLNHYQRGRVRHARRLHAAEEQMVGFPRAPHDDLVDAVGAGVSHFLDPSAPPRRVTVQAMSYVS